MNDTGWGEKEGRIQVVTKETTLIYKIVLFFYLTYLIFIIDAVLTSIILVGFHFLLHYFFNSVIYFEKVCRSMSYIKLCTKWLYRMTVFVDMKIYTPEKNKIDSSATFSYFLNLPHFLSSNSLRSQDSLFQK